MDEGHDVEMHAVFVGEVHPVSGGWALDDPIEIPFGDSHWTMILSSSRVHVVVRGEMPSDMETFINEVRAVSQGCIDSLGMLLGASLRLELTSIIVNGNRIYLPSPFWYAKAVSRVEGDRLIPVVAAAVSEPLARLALADLRVAQTSPDDSGFLAYRAVESVRQYFFCPADGKRSDEKSWERLRTSLDFSKSELVRLSELARVRRHGGLPRHTEAERIESFDIALRVVKSFLEFLHRVETPEASSGSD
ncbi:hypothetical protein Acsp07_11200 [Actinomycetospora sp. NBRC 106378]|nr:hypothetical protein Acsp07_11200 [Actinomycetospora sp. NBRC 106378]